MSCICCCKRAGIALVVVVAVLAGFFARFNGSSPVTPPENTYWGPDSPGSSPPKDDETIQKFVVEYDDKLVARLRGEIANSKWVPPLEGSAYHNGINMKTFQGVMDYWGTKFDFKKAENDINAFQHFRTQIEGLNIHFFRSSPKKPVPAGVQVVPVMLIHGWPGSFIEFLKVAHQLAEVKDNVVFDIVVPSLPGYGFSEAPSKHGVDAVVTARIFKKLMTRLGISRYFVQGGDWGSAVTAAMGQLYPQDVRGIHLNFLAERSSLSVIIKKFLVGMFPNQLGDGQMPPCMGHGFKADFYNMLQESGYFHMQATKPDTLGLALLNSPVGLAGYIMEKFSTGTDMSFRALEDGGLGKRIPIDEVLANVMVYYASNSIVSSVRFYKENVLTGNMFNLYKNPITVPAGYAIFPHEIGCFPKFIVKGLLGNLTTITYQPRGGHFAAVEEPKLMADDVRAFVVRVLELYPEKA